VIELLLQAERALSMGLIDEAERVYRVASEADPRNSIAVVGLARVALERGDDEQAWREARRALGIDAENAAARRIVERMEEVWRHRGIEPPELAAPRSADEAELLAGSGAEPDRAVGAQPAAQGTTPAAPPSPSTPPSPSSLPSTAPPSTAAPRGGIIARLLRRNRS
jgi:hypothetical protein